MTKSRAVAAPARHPTPVRRKARQKSIGREYVQGLERGFAVIKAFTADSPVLSVTDVAERAGLGRAVARRYLLTLLELGYVVQDGSAFSLAPRLLDLGFAYLSSLSVGDIAQPYMQRVADELHESCSIAVLDIPDIVLVARVPTKRIMSVNLVVGSRLPAHATSMGKVLLAHLAPPALDHYFEAVPLRRFTERTIINERRLREVLADVRQRGFALSDEESEYGLRSLSVPLFNRRGEVKTAIAVACHVSHVSLEVMKDKYLPVLQTAAREISAALGANAARHQAPPAARKRVI